MVNKTIMILQESIRELLDQEKNHCRECVKAAVESVKGDFQSYIEQQKQVRAAVDTFKGDFQSYNDQQKLVRAAVESVKG